MKRTLCGFILLFAAACSQSPTAPTPPPTQSGPAVITLQWNVTAASCAPVTTPPSQPSTSNATIVSQTDREIRAAWPFASNGRTGTLYARFILENNVWALCSWDVADV